jgi:hypothetical protein
VRAIFRRAAFVVAPAVLIAGALGALYGTADARTGTPAVHAGARGQTEARGQQSQQCRSTSAVQPSCSFATEIQLPLAVSISAQASPSEGQDATVAWTVSCSVNGGKASNSSGTHTGAVPYRISLKLPSSENGDCTVNANLTMNRTGNLTGVLAYTVGQQVELQQPTSDPKQGAPLFYFMCMRDASQGHTTGAHAIISNCSYVYMSAWTYNGKSLVHGGLCLTDPHGGWVGTKLALEKCTGAANQTWTYNGGGQAYGPFTLKSPHLCLDDPKYTKVVNTPLTVYSCRNTPDEYWSLSS